MSLVPLSLPPRQTIRAHTLTCEASRCGCAGTVDSDPAPLSRSECLRLEAMPAVSLREKPPGKPGARPRGAPDGPATAAPAGTSGAGGRGRIAEWAFGRIARHQQRIEQRWHGAPPQRDPAPPRRAGARSSTRAAAANSAAGIARRVAGAGYRCSSLAPARPKKRLPASWRRPAAEPGTRLCAGEMSGDQTGCSLQSWSIKYAPGPGMR